MKPPTISTFIACKNHGKYLQEAIDSVMNQTFRPSQFILIDDGSTDNTQQVIKRNADKDRRFKRVTHENSLGNIRSFNHALDLCDGDFIHLMSSDDFLSEKTFYEDASILLMTKENIGFVSIGLQWCDEEGRLLPQQAIPPVQGEVNPQAALELMKSHGNFTNGGGTLIKRRVQQEVGYYNRDYPFAADWLNWIKVFGNGHSAYYFQRPGFIYRKHKAAMTYNNVTPEKEIRGCYQAIEKALTDIAIKAAENSLPLPLPDERSSPISQMAGSKSV